MFNQPKASVKEVFAYSILAKQNPVLTPTIRARSIEHATEKLAAISFVASYVSGYFDQHLRPEPELRAWAALHFLDQGSEMVLPPGMEKYSGDRLVPLPGTLRRHAADNGGYGGFLLNRLAEMALSVSVPDREKPSYFFTAFPLLKKAVLDSYIFQDSFMNAVQEAIQGGELVLVYPHQDLVDDLVQLAEVDFPSLREYIPEMHREQAAQWLDAVRAGYAIDIAERIRNCGTAICIFQSLKEKFLD